MIIDLKDLDSYVLFPFCFFSSRYFNQSVGLSVIISIVAIKAINIFKAHFCIDWKKAYREKETQLFRLSQQVSRQIERIKQLEKQLKQLDSEKDAIQESYFKKIEEMEVLQSFQSEITAARIQETKELEELRELKARVEQQLVESGSPVNLQGGLLSGSQIFQRLRSFGFRSRSESQLP